MRITSAGIFMASQRSLAQTRTRSESVKAWVKQQDRIEVSPEARQLLASTQVSKKGQSDLGGEEMSVVSPQDRVRIQILEWLLHRKIHLLRRPPDKTAIEAATNRQEDGEKARPASPRPGWGLSYEGRETYQEREQLSFAAQGVIQTADGQTLDFTVHLNLSRAFQSESVVTLKAGDALVDPLVINYDGTAAELTNTTFAFDLDLDGAPEQMPFLRAGSGFLALDRNADGRVNDGSELFGPSAGDGFTEVARYDSDHNGWLDENDPIFDRLRIWTKDQNGHDVLFALGQKQIGAIYVGGLTADFTVTDQMGKTQGQVRKMGVFVGDKGTAGTVQQLDVVV